VRVDVADLTRLDGLAQPLDVPLGEPVVVVAEHLGGDELRLADDPIERLVLAREAEVRGEAEHLGLDAGGPLGGGVLHRVPHAAVEVADELVEDLLLALEVEVEGALGHAGRLRDLHDRRVVEADVREDLLRGFE
jgi:hypothetical protein